MTSSPSKDPADTEGHRHNRADVETAETDTQGHAPEGANEQSTDGDDDVEGHIYVQEPGAPGSRDR